MTFDEFACQYESEVDSALGIFGGDPSYYLAEKVRLLKSRVATRESARILDYGSGTGLAVPHLQRAWPMGEITCSDESSASLEIVRKLYKNVRVKGVHELESEEFDLIFVSNVLHHVPVKNRSELITHLSKRLLGGGVIAIFEHNPLNPLTRLVVSRCSFDEGVVLIGRRHLKKTLQNQSGLVVLFSGYFLIFPSGLKILRFLDRFLYRVPIGAQHLTLARFE